ncbi:hypothetical protein AB1N83_002108 [Pleurotus pulmonarius]
MVVSIAQYSFNIHINRIRDHVLARRWKKMKTDSVKLGQTDGTKKVAICKLKLPGTGWVPLLRKPYCFLQWPSKPQLDTLHHNFRGTYKHSYEFSTQNAP